MKIGIREVKTNKTGTVIVKRNNRKSQTCFKQKIQQQLNEELKIIELTINKNTNVKEVNINKDMNTKSNEEILTKIKSQNEILNDGLNF